MRIFSLLLCVMLSACTTQHAYEALQSRNCWLSQGKLMCEDSMDYGSYQKMREELLKQEQPRATPQKAIPLPGPRAETPQP